MNRIISILLILSFVGCNEVILHDLSEAQANQVWLSLEAAAIPAQKEKALGGWSIAVDKAFAVKALKTLSEQKLPRGFWKQKEENQTSLIPSKEERQLSREKQLAKTLEGSLLSLPGVSDVHVQLVLGVAEVSEKNKNTASVLLVTERSNAIQPQQVRDLTAGATGIPKESVAVAIINEPE